MAVSIGDEITLDSSLLALMQLDAFGVGVANDSTMHKGFLKNIELL